MRDLHEAVRPIAMAAPKKGEWEFGGHKSERAFEWSSPLGVDVVSSLEDSQDGVVRRLEISHHGERATPQEIEWALACFEASDWERSNDCGRVASFWKHVDPDMRGGGKCKR